MGVRLPVQTDFSTGQVGFDIEQNASNNPEVNNGLKRCINFIPKSQGSLDRRKGNSHSYTIDSVTDGRVIPFYINSELSYGIVISNDGKLRVVNENGIYVNPTTPATEMVPNPDLSAGTPTGKEKRWDGSISADVVSDVSYPPPLMPEASNTLTGSINIVFFQRWIALRIDIQPGLEFADFNFEMKLDTTYNESNGTITTYKVEMMENPEVETILYTAISPLNSLTAFTFSPQGASIVYARVTYVRPPDYSIFDVVASDISRMSMIVDGSAGGIVELDHFFSNIDFSEIQYAMSPGLEFIYLTHRSAEPSRVKYIRQTGIFTYEQLITDTIISAPPTDWAVDDYPGSVAFFQDRLWFGGTNTYVNKLYSSAVRDFFDFTPVVSDPGADTPITLQMSTYCDIQWLADTSTLVVGADNGIYPMTSVDGILKPGDTSIEQRVTYSCNRVQPIIIGDRIVYSTGDGLKLRDFSYDDNEKSWISKDLTFSASDITFSKIKEIAFLLDPDNLIKLRLSNETIVVCSYQKHLDKIGWYKEDNTVDDKSIAAIRNKGVYVTVYLTKTIENKLNIEFETMSIDNYMDSMTTINHSPASNTISIPHLAGRTVNILADGAIVPDVDLDMSGNGVISVDASTIYAGLHSSSIAVTRDISDVDRYGNGSLSLMKRFNKIWARIYKSTIPMINGQRVPSRTPDKIMNERVGEVSEDVQITEFSYDRLSNITIEQDLPLPCRVLGIFGELGEEKL